ncbi:MAG: exodeoxyribonuclease VII large subunit [Burkholderiales bacterium]|jgi:exodeoxyribonuclease VII large subunit|nr:exodeoxyribonuclease VII large subunit [Burkholderiales bacterium]
MPSPSLTTPPSSAAAWPVSFLVNSVRLMIERHIGLIWVAGEVSGFTRAASGHCYFTLKDDQAQVRCTLWKAKALALGVGRAGGLSLRDGQHVEVRAVPTLYEGRGEFQLNVDMIRLAGQGALYERFLQLKAALEAEGLFAAERKRPLPDFPRGVALVTSRHGAALHDMLATLARRWPTLPVVLYPTAVQGDGAAASIAEAIRIANARAADPNTADGIDVLIVARGGGSLEDLWAFNEEAVVRAVAASRLPVVSGVGHETDFTLCDFAADLRAPTPTAAAAAVAPDGPAWRRHLRDQERHMQRVMENVLARAAQRLDRVSARLTHPRARLSTQITQLQTLTTRLRQAWQKQLAPMAQRWQFSQQRRQHALRFQWAAYERRLASLTERLTLLDPQHVLARGYAIVTAADGHPALDAATLRVNDPVTLTLARGKGVATIDEVFPDERP